MLEVDTLTRRIGRKQEPWLAMVERVLDLLPIVLRDITVDDENLVRAGLVIELTEEVLEGETALFHRGG
jgi:hypothetical protein